MEALENLLTRRSTKSYDPTRMPAQELVDRIMEAGTYAPSGRGKQSPVIVQVSNQEVRNRLSTLNAEILGTKTDPFYGAPIVLAVLADKTCHTYLYDGSLVMANLMLAAHALGIGSCWIHRAKEVFALPEGKQLLEAWGIQGDYEGIAFCTLGYALREPKPQTTRKADYIRRVL